MKEIRITEEYFREQIMKVREKGGSPTVVVFPECTSFTIGNQTIFPTKYPVICEVFGMKIFIDSNLPDGQWYLLDESQIMELEEPKKTLWDKREDNPELLKKKSDFLMDNVFKEKDVKEALMEFLTFLREAGFQAEQVIGDFEGNVREFDLETKAKETFGEEFFKD